MGMRDGLPVLPGHYNPHITWRELLDHREAAMAKRHVAHHEAWSEHTKRLPPLKVGMKVFVQNQVGNNPRRWDKTGVVMECNEFDQYVVKMDGTGRLTRRNRKFLRRLTPITRKPLPKEETSLQPTPPPTLAQVPAGPLVPHVVPHNTLQREDGVETPHEPQPHYTLQREDEVVIPQPHNTSQREDEVAIPHEPQPRAEGRSCPPTPPAPQPGMRPQRARKPNVKYSPDEWDLGPVTHDHP